MRVQKQNTTLFCRAISILFVLSILYTVVAPSAILTIQQHLIKKEIKRKIKNNLPQKDLTLIVVSLNNNLSWINSHEFTYQNKMYDVVKAEKKSNGIIHYYCIDDKKEKELFVNLNRLTKQKSKSENRFTKTLFGLLWNHTQNKENKIFNIFSEEKENYFLFSFSYRHLFNKRVNQPPELV